MSNPTIEILKSHTSVRRFTDKPLPDGLLEELVACGQQASTSSNLQTYSIIHVADPDVKTEITKLCDDQLQIKESAAFLAICADLHRDRLAFDLHSSGQFDTSYIEAMLMSTIDAALVMQNIAIAAESHELGICMIGAIRNHPIEIGKLLELPDHVFAISGFCIGYPDPEHPTTIKPRLSQQAILHRDRYLNDDAMLVQMESYNQTMTEFYDSQGMHDQDPSWTHVVSGRVSNFQRRADLDVFLRKQGFNLQG